MSVGVRLADTAVGRIPSKEERPGGYWRSGGVWHCCPPGNPYLFGNLSDHEVTEHEDGTITVSPSILIMSGAGQEEWHGYLERGVWRVC